MCVRSDTWIRKMSLGPLKMIDPFSERVAGKGIISYGLQPSGYDARLDGKLVKIVTWARGRGEPLDPLAMDESLFTRLENVDRCLIPSHGFVIGLTMERFRIPRDHTVIGAPKTSYSRAGVSLSVVGIDPGWEGRLVLHLANPTEVPIWIYPGMGLVNLKFLRIHGKVEKDYSELRGTRFMDRAPIIS